MSTRVCDTSEGLVYIRQGRLGDLKALVALEKAVFGRHALDPSTLFWLLLRHWPGLLIAEQSGVLVGYILTRVSFLSRWTRRGGITSIAVSPAYLRQGIGRRLMEVALEFLIRARVKAIDLEVSVDNTAALSLYLSLGFADEKPLPNYYGPNEHGLRMTLYTSDDSSASREGPD